MAITAHLIHVALKKTTSISFQENTVRWATAEYLGKTHVKMEL